MDDEYLIVKTIVLMTNILCQNYSINGQNNIFNVKTIVLMTNI